MESERTDSADDGCIEEFSPIKVPFIHECAREYLTNHSVPTIIDKGMSVELSEGRDEMDDCIRYTWLGRLSGKVA